MAEHVHEGHRERMRQRFAENGLTGFAPHEALELLLFYAIPRRNVNPLAHRLIDHFGSLGAVLEAAPDQLQRVPGIGEATASLISMVSALYRHAEQERLSDRAFVTNLKEAKAYCRHLFAGKQDEVLYVICLDAQGRVLRAVPAIRGTIDEIVIYPRIVVGMAIRHNAHSVVLAHNHPSGACEPSDADLRTTDLLRVALAGVDISLMDHLIYADGECVSMVQWQQMQNITPLYHGAKQPKAADTKQGGRRSIREADDGEA